MMKTVNEIVAAELIDDAITKDAENMAKKRSHIDGYKLLEQMDMQEQGYANDPEGVAAPSWKLAKALVIDAIG